MDTIPLQRSKGFRAESGERAWRRTATVAELIAFLQQFPSGMPVMVAWEGTVHGLGAFGVEEYDCGRHDDRAVVLMFDVENEDSVS